MAIKQRIKDMKELSILIRDEVAKLVDTGTHLDAARTTQRIAKKLGLNERMVNYTHIELRNKLNEYKFKKIPYEQRALFLPHCLKNAKSCKAKMTDEGLKCTECGKCQLDKLVKMGREYGYIGPFIAPGGSMVYNLTKKYRPKAVVGVACHNEVNLGMDKADEYNIPAQGVLLLREGCKDTAVNLDEVREKMELIADGMALKSENSKNSNKK